MRQSVSYELSTRRVGDVYESASDYLRENAGRTTKSALGSRVIWDVRDNRFEPTDGFVLGGGATAAGLGGTEKFYKLSTEAGYWYAVSQGWVLALLGEAGHIAGFGQDIRLSERFFLGGSKLRGFEYGGIGPRDKGTGDALGSNNYWLVTAELSVPLGLPKELGVKGRLFTDVGSAFGIDLSGSDLVDSATPRASAGVGLTWTSPLGPLTFDFGFAFLKDNSDRTRLFNFSFGTRF